MLRVLRNGSRWLMWVVIVGVGAVFVLYLGIGGGFAGGGGPGAVVRVGERVYSARDVLRVRRNLERRYREVLGEQFDAEEAATNLDEMAARSLVRQAIFAREAERMGLRVAPDELRDYLRSMPGAADDSGRLNQAGITAYAERTYGSVRAFEDALRDEILARKAEQLVTASVDVTTEEARESLRARQEKAKIALVRVAPKAPEDLEIAEPEVDALLAEEPERVREAYEERRVEFDRPEQVRARHILLRVPEDAGEEKVAEVRERAEEVLARIEEGAAFADVALEVSQDPGSRSRGGDLGYFSRDDMVDAFAEAAFALEPGERSGVVRTTHGFHLIKALEHRPARTVPFEEARREVARDLLRERRGRERARERAEELAAAVGEGRSLVEVARERGLTLDRPPAFGRSADGYVPELGRAPEVMNAAFTLTEERPSRGRILEGPDGELILIELLERSAPGEEVIASQLEEERRRLRQQRKNRIQTAWLDQRRTTLREGGELAFDLDALRGGGGARPPARRAPAPF